jgi:hypothetical protein
MQRRYERPNTEKSKSVFKPQNTQNTQKKEFLLKEESYAILGAIFAVYEEMGCGFLEAVYQECLERELHENES